jgi:hypothetical protein
VQSTKKARIRAPIQSGRGIAMSSLLNFYLKNAARRPMVLAFAVNRAAAIDGFI